MVSSHERLAAPSPISEQSTEPGRALLERAVAAEFPERQHPETPLSASGNRRPGTRIEGRRAIGIVPPRTTTTGGLPGPQEE